MRVKRWNYSNQHFSYSFYFLKRLNRPNNVFRKSYKRPFKKRYRTCSYQISLMNLIVFHLTPVLKTPKMWT